MIKFILRKELNIGRKFIMKKLFVLLLSVLLVVTALSGCGKKPEGDSSEPSVITLDMSTLFIVPNLDATQKVEDAINDYFTEHFDGDSLLAVGFSEMIKIHYHTNEPWKVLEYCASLGEIYDIVVEDMDRQSRGLKG